jgi:hypothetical protein
MQLDLFETSPRTPCFPEPRQCSECGELSLIYGILHMDSMLSISDYPMCAECVVKEVRIRRFHGKPTDGFEWVV